jgi:hypothetical protein
MKNKTYILNTILAAVVGVYLLGAVLVRTFLPLVILPDYSIPNLVLISLIVVVLEHYICPGSKRCYICIPVFAAITFGLLPFAAGFVTLIEALKVGLAGCVVFTAVTWLFTSVQDRVSSGPAAKAAPVISAFGIYLASQALINVFF